ncbi:MAG: hypothetical protein ACUVWR_15135 [Anaerolineae bacterium]
MMKRPPGPAWPAPRNWLRAGVSCSDLLRDRSPFLGIIFDWSKV